MKSCVSLCLNFKRKKHWDCEAVRHLSSKRETLCKTRNFYSGIDPFIFPVSQLLVSVSCSPGSAGMKLCGNQLVGMLNFICGLNLDLARLHSSSWDDYLATMLMRRKRSLFLDDASDDLERFKWNNFDRFEKYFCRFYMNKRGGLSSTCCTRQCTFSELRGFC